MAIVALTVASSSTSASAVILPTPDPNPDRPRAGQCQEGMSAVVRTGTIYLIAARFPAPPRLVLAVPDDRSYQLAGLDLWHLDGRRAIVLGCLSADRRLQVVDGQPESMAVLDFSRTGGFAGQHHHVTILDGRAGMDSRTTMVTVGSHWALPRLDQGQWDTFQRALITARIWTLAPYYPSTCTNCFGYTVRHKGREVRGDDVSIPAQLRPLTTFLSSLATAS